jgi:hypothetical protein
MAYANVAIAPFSSLLTKELAQRIEDAIYTAFERQFSHLKASMTAPPLAPIELISSIPPSPSLLAIPIDLPSTDETDSCPDCSVDEPPPPQTDVPAPLQARLPLAALPTSCRLLLMQKTLLCAPYTPTTYI